MSVTGSSTPSRSPRSEATVRFSARNKVGFVLAILLSIPNMLGPLNPTPEGEAGPPMLILFLGTALGVLTIGAVALGWTRGNAAAIRVASAAIIISVITALPAFFVPDVPAGLRVVAAGGVLLGITSVVLMLTPARPVADRS